MYLTTAARLARRMLCGVATLASVSTVLVAQPTVANFNSLTTANGEGVRYVQNCYIEAQLQFTLTGVGCDDTEAFATWGPENPLFYTGSPALFNNSTASSSFDIMAAGGQAFSLLSIDLTTFLGEFGNPTSVTFTGMLMGGGTVSRMVDLPGATTTPTTIMFTDFSMLSSVRLTVTDPEFEPYVQFDNVTASVVPEPSTVILLAGGLVTLAALARRRRV